MKINAHSHIFKLHRNWKIRFLIAGIFWSGFASIFSAAFINLIFPGFIQHWGGIYIVVIWIFSCAGYLKWKNWFSFSVPSLIRLLHHEHPELEYSLDLISREFNQSNTIIHFQQNRTIEAYERIRPSIKIQQPLPTSLLCFLLGLFFLFVSLGFSKPNLNNQITFKATTESQSKIQSKPVSTLQLKLNQMTCNVIPPAYTKIKPYEADSLSFKAVEGSKLTWNIKANKQIDSGKIWINDKKSYELQILNSDRVRTQYTVVQTFIYRFVLESDSSAYESEYFRIDMKQDHPPFAQIREIRNYTLLNEVYQEFKVPLAASDDYGLNEAKIITTVTSGKGESVTFHNDTLVIQALNRGVSEFESEFKMDIASFDLNPGDELYFHFEVTDIRTPEPQTSRTEKYIIALVDTGQTLSIMDSGLGVNRMPEYFRSQRQIIIDTENLISQKSLIQEQDFINRSNNIGIDQKLLRLRYGQFLGEEFETNIGLVGEEMHESEQFRDSILNEELYLMEDHEHEEPVQGFNSNPSEISDHELEELLDPYAHYHDMEEQATYFDQQTRSKLKAALAEMWDAEMHLRMTRPERALPFEYRALKLIKEIQQASRIYVERIGFDPPQINESLDRLSGKLDGIDSKRIEPVFTPESVKKDLNAALMICEQILEGEDDLTDEDQMVLKNAARYMADFATENPGFLHILQLFQALVTQDYPPEERLAIARKVQNGIYRIIPSNGVESHSMTLPGMEINRDFLSKLRQLDWK